MDKKAAEEQVGYPHTDVVFLAPLYADSYHHRPAKPRKQQAVPCSRAATGAPRKTSRSPTPTRKMMIMSWRGFARRQKPYGKGKRRSGWQSSLDTFRQTGIPKTIQGQVRPGMPPMQPRMRMKLVRRGRPRRPTPLLNPPPPEQVWRIFGRKYNKCWMGVDDRHDPPERPHSRRTYRQIPGATRMWMPLMWYGVGVRNGRTRLSEGTLFPLAIFTVYALERREVMYSMQSSVCRHTRLHLSPSLASGRFGEVWNHDRGLESNADPCKGVSSGCVSDLNCVRIDWVQWLPPPPHSLVMEYVIGQQIY